VRRQSRGMTSRGVHRGVSKGVEGSSMAGPGETLGSPWPLALFKIHPGMSPIMGKVLGFALVH
jgi:hypothetical protein